MKKAIIFVLGGSGAGKGSQCSRLAQKYHIQHLSVGDVLRAESRKPESEYAEIILENMRNGTIGPMEITVELLRRAMDEAILEHGTFVFLLDGFPRKLDQLQLFEATVQPADFAIYLECSEDIRMKRLVERGKANGNSIRSDDDPETIKRRFFTFTNTTLPLIQDLELQGRLFRVNGANDADTVFQDMEQVLKKRWLAEGKFPGTRNGS